MAGTLSIVVNGTINGFGVPYNSAGNLYAAVKGQKQSSVTYSGAGTLSGSTAFGYSRSAALSGSGTLVGDLDQKYFMQYQEATTGTLSATTTSKYYQVKTMALSGGGTLTAAAIQPKVLFDNWTTAGSSATNWGTTATISWNHVNAGNYIFTTIAQSGVNTPSLTVTCNGNAMSLLGSVSNSSSIRLYVYGTNNLITGTNAMQIVSTIASGSQNIGLASTSFSSFGSIGTIKTAASYGTSASITNITTTANGALFTILGFRNSGDRTDNFANTFEVGANSTAIYFAGQQRSGTYATTASTTNSVTAYFGVVNPITFNFENTQNENYAMITVPINR